MSSQKPSLVVIGNSHSNVSTRAFLTKFARVADELANQVYIISGEGPRVTGKIHWIHIGVKAPQRAGLSFLHFALTQGWICLQLLKMRNQYDQAVVLAPPYFLPVVCLRVLRKKVALHVDGKPDSPLLRIFSAANFRLAHNLMPEAWRLLDYWGIKQRDKATLCPQFVDTALFTIHKPLDTRDRVVGFIGWLDKNKGVPEMLEAIRRLNRAGEDAGFVIAGAGSLADIVREFASTNSNVSYEGALPWNRVPETLNECKLVVIPSFSEGLPNVMLEAMACGTPVLATPVGGIPDFIMDEQTGFIMSSNQPDSVASNILRALNHPQLNLISHNALP